VNCIVTSPPYYGLRDYGTSQWEGGSEECDHRASKATVHASHVFKGMCGQCGATRIDHQIGLEDTPDEFITAMVNVFAEVRRVLRDDGTLWLNLGDSYASIAGGYDESGSRGATATIGAKTQSAVLKGRRRIPSAGLKPKDLMGIPWRVALALQADGWYLRSDIIWHKPNPMPESVTDRPSKAHEYIFLLSKNEHYFYDVDAVREPQATLGERHEGRSGYRDHHPSKESRTANERALHPLGANKRTVWTVATQPYDGAHFATFPPKLIEPCILAGSAPGSLVLDPFFGSGTTGMVAEKHGRRWIGFDLGYEDLAKQRTAQRSLPLDGAP
jgi:DNA modification methylase